MTLATSESTAAARRTALIASAAMIVFAIVATLLGQREALAVPSILPLLFGAVIVSETMSAYVLFAEFVRSRLVWLLFVAAAYLVTAVLSVPYILTFPGVFAPAGVLGATPQTALDLWITWHLAFPVLACVALVAGRLPEDVRVETSAAASRLVGLTIGACVALGCAAPFLLEALGRHVPDLVRGRDFTAMTTSGVLPVIIAADAFALGLLHARTRNMMSVSLWLSVALVASALDAAMGVLSSRYSYGWYAGKAFLVVSSGVMLVGFIGESARLRTRLGLARDDLLRARERERHLAQERVHRLANFDELTGLPNRLHLEELLRKRIAAPAAGNRFAVVFLSLDRFKDVNDDFGHAAADGVLADVAARVTQKVRDGDTVARFSGDEFVVLAPMLPDAAAAEALAEALRKAVELPFDVQSRTVKITASVGIARYPDDGASAEAVLDNADVAARQAKRSGGNRTSFYSHAFYHEARTRRRLQEDLSVALLRDQFVLHYQPIVDLQTGELRKVEALIRWVHPQRGLVAPGDFIPLAEQTGLMRLIGYWVIEEAVRQAAAWRATGWPIPISVNVSARQLDDHGFLLHLTRTLDEARLAASLIELEITESAAMSDASMAQSVLEQCHSLGHHLSLDDFGTYYSSLTYLKRLPIDSVKIDKSFMQGYPFVRSDAAIVAGILSLARALERTVVGEGIENDAQRASLREAGCEYGQGFLFARPMPASALDHWRHGGVPVRRAQAQGAR